MPHYDYVCIACGTLVEVVHGVHAAGPAACALCGGTMRKAVSAPSIVFKGSGWAKKDRSSKAASAAAKSERGGGEGSASDKPKAPDKAATTDGHGAGKSTPAD